MSTKRPLTRCATDCGCPEQRPRPSRDGYNGPYSPLPSPNPLPPTVPPVTGGGPMVSRPKPTQRTLKCLNTAFEKMDAALKAYRKAAAEHGSPIRGVSFTITPEGYSKTNVRFKSRR